MRFIHQHVFGAVLAAAAVIALSACGPTQSDDRQGGSRSSSSSGSETATAGGAKTASATSDAQPGKENRHSSTTAGMGGATTSQVVEDDEGVIHPCPWEALGKQTAPQFESSEYRGGKDRGYGYVTVTNGGSAACTMSGYPTVRMLTLGGKELPTKVAKDLAPAPAEFVLRPGESAGFKMEWGTSREGEAAYDPIGIEVVPPTNTGAVGMSVNRGDGKSDMHPRQADSLHVSAWEEAKRK